MTLAETRLRVRRAHAREALGFMLQDRTWNAYGIGYLERGATRATEAWTAEREGTVVSVIVQAQLAQLTSVFASGDAAGIAQVLGHIRGLPQSGVFSARPDGLRELERRLHIGTSYQMMRMRLSPGELRPRAHAPVRRLGAADLGAVRAAYGMWTDSQQLPGQLQRGVYFGVFDGREDQLIAIAGTHCISRRYGVAAIGNVLTHINFRRRGLASTTTTAVAQELMAMGCDEVVLNVREGNDAARATYRRLGFSDHCPFVEGLYQGRR